MDGNLSRLRWLSMMAHDGRPGSEKAWILGEAGNTNPIPRTRFIVLQRPERQDKVSRENERMDSPEIGTYIRIPRHLANVSSKAINNEFFKSLQPKLGLAQPSARSPVSAAAPLRPQT